MTPAQRMGGLIYAVQDQVFEVAAAWEDYDISIVDACFFEIDDAIFIHEIAKKPRYARVLAQALAAGCDPHVWDGEGHCLFYVAAEAKNEEGLAILTAHVDAMIAPGACTQKLHAFLKNCPDISFKIPRFNKSGEYCSPLERFFDRYVSVKGPYPTSMNEAQVATLSILFLYPMHGSLCVEQIARLKQYPRNYITTIADLLDAPAVQRIISFNTIQESMVEIISRLSQPISFCIGYTASCVPAPLLGSGFQEDKQQPPCQEMGGSLKI